MKRQIFGLLFLSLALSSKAQIDQQNKTHEIFEILKNPNALNIDALLKEKNYQLVMSRPQKIRAYDGMNYVYRSLKNKTGYMLVYVGDKRIAEYYSTFNEDDFENFLADAKIAGFKQIQNRGDDNTVTVCGYKDLGLLFSSTTANGNPMYLIQAIELPIWNHYNRME